MVWVRKINHRFMHDILNIIENDKDNSKKVIVVNGKTLFQKDYETIMEIEDYLNIRFFEYSYCRFGKIDFFYVSFLGFSQEQMDHLIDLLSHLTSLEKLNLNNNSLTHLSPSIDRIKGLKQLYLHSNSLRSLPNSFKNLSNLTHLYLHLNRFETFPEQILSLPKLEVLTLNNNLIRVIPEKIVNLHSLRIFTFYSNPLWEISSEFASMKNLAFSPIQFENLSMISESSINAYIDHLIQRVDYPRELQDFYFLLISNEFRNKIYISRSHENVNKLLFFLLFLEDNWLVRIAIAGNLCSPIFKDYILLFFDYYWDVRKTAASNPNATIHNEFKVLFDDQNSQVRLHAARNEFAPRFYEFYKLLEDEEEEIRNSAKQTLEHFNKKFKLEKRA